MSAYAAAGQHHHHAGPGETGVSWLGGRSLLSPDLGLALFSVDMKLGIGSGWCL